MTRPVVLIGAARSGTKIARDVFAAAAEVGHVPYDIGFVWRYGNERVPHDVLDPSTVTPRVRRFIRRYVDRYADVRSGTVIEKTVGNALRIPFVHAVMPDAAFIHLVRDGVDVVESTRRQWLASPDASYLLQKLGHFPARLLPSYGAKFVASQLRHYLRPDTRVGTWGPRYPGIDDDLGSNGLLAVCARQWQTAVDYAGEALSTIDAQTIQLRYEDLVGDPIRTVAGVLNELGLEPREQTLHRATASLESGRAGGGARRLAGPELQQLESLVGSQLARLGYPPATQREVKQRD